MIKIFCWNPLNLFFHVNDNENSTRNRNFHDDHVTHMVTGGRDGQVGGTEVPVYTCIRECVSDDTGCRLLSAQEFSFGPSLI